MKSRLGRRDFGLKLETQLDYFRVAWRGGIVDSSSSMHIGGATGRGFCMGLDGMDATHARIARVWRRGDNPL
jgi:hypothetical protein